MTTDLATVVVLGAAAVLALKSILEIADTIEKSVGYFLKLKKAVDRAYIASKMFPRRKRSRLFKIVWAVATGHPLIGPENDPPPKSPGGSRKPRPRLIAFVGYRALVSEARVLGAV